MSMLYCFSLNCLNWEDDFWSTKLCHISEELWVLQCCQILNKRKAEDWFCFFCVCLILYSHAKCFHWTWLQGLLLNKCIDLIDLHADDPQIIVLKVKCISHTSSLLIGSVYLGRAHVIMLHRVNRLQTPDQCREAFVVRMSN